MSGMKCNISKMNLDEEAMLQYRTQNMEEKISKEGSLTIVERKLGEKQPVKPKISLNSLRYPIKTYVVAIPSTHQYQQ
jgi:hypothetical protein